VRRAGSGVNGEKKDAGNRAENTLSQTAGGIDLSRAHSVTSVRNFSFPKGLTNGMVKLKTVMVKLARSFAPNFCLFPALRHRLSRSCSLFFRFLFLASLLSLLGGAAGASPYDQNPPPNTLAPGLPFAIADFDGDLHPDLASIQTGPDDSGTTDYWIQLQLSASGRQSIRLAGPSGGLLIEARDVNGDRAVDLVLVTAWFRKPVAIFLNDGHGRFSRAEPAAFPAAFSALAPRWASTSGRATDCAGVPPQSRAGLCSQVEVLALFRQRANATAVSNAGFPLSSFVISHAGRAPPSQVQHS